MPFLLALLLALWAPLLHAVEIVGEVKVEPAGPDSITLEWRTDVVCGTRVSYGVAPDALNQRAGEGTGIDHRVTLAGLQPGQRYHFTVGTVRKKLASGSFSMASSPAAKVAKEGATSPAQGSTPAATSPATKKSSPKALPNAPPTRITWGNMRTLEDHFIRHGPDFRSRDADHYAAEAWAFRQRALQTGLPMKLDSDGTLRVFDPATGAFAAYNRDGTTKTYFKPGSRDYFARQPGRPVKPQDLTRP